MNESEVPLDIADLGSDPIVVFRRWFEDARAAGLAMPEAMALATTARDARPSLRWVLLKDVDERGGFSFFTNYDSRKARELADNPHAAVAFYWEPLSRQVRIEGRIERLSDADIAAYWHSRHRASQISALVSKQSRPVPGRELMDQLRDEARRLYDGREVPRPEHWGGYRVVPEAIEFWQGREHRFHDRFRFERDGRGAWQVSRLWP
jgi:pyridoxamine 5'-phosphate oxidase